MVQHIDSLTLNHGDNSAPPPEQVLASRPRKRSAAKALIIFSALALAVGGSAFAASALTAAPEPPASATPPNSRVQITAGNLSSETTVRGKLQFAKQIDIASARGGAVTELPGPETLLAPGAVAYRVDTQPAVVMAGSMPAWRDFTTGMTPGPDVRQLEENLRNFGYLDAEPSEDFTWHTRWAIRTWQRDLGLVPSDTLSKDLVLFADQPLQVGKLDRQVGDRVESGAKLYRAHVTTKEVSAHIKPSDAGLAPVGAVVAIDLPGGETTEGTVMSVGVAEESQPQDGADAPPGGASGGSSGEVLLPIVVGLNDQSATQALSLVSVSLRLGAVVREDVLTVPIDALIPVANEKFAVELVSPKKSGAAASAPQLTPVTVGTFASGLVEISGAGIREGLEVTVPKR